MRSAWRMNGRCSAGRPDARYCCRLSPLAVKRAKCWSHPFWKKTSATSAIASGNIRDAKKWRPTGNHRLAMFISAPWAREFYPVYDRQGLIIDVRHNQGGNIDSWVLGKLLRKAWSYWQPRVGNPISNMQYAFRGYIVVLCDRRTASDGEAFAEGIRRLGLGKIIGVRTWGGEIWLSSSNVLADRGIATAAENGVYGPEGKWLIEGHGVDPDIEVDDLPHATFTGSDAQLQAALDL